MKISRNEEEILILEANDWLGGLIMISFGVVFGVIGVLMLIELIIGGLIIIAISAAILYAFYRLIARVQIRFDRVDGTVEIRERTLHSQKLKSYPLAEISGTTIKEKISRSNGTRTKLSQINLTRKDGGDLIPLTRSFSSGSQYRNLAGAIDEWLESD